MKYKLINKTTGEEHICEKVVIDGWDYYVSDEDLEINKPFLGYCWNWRIKINYFESGLREYAGGRYLGAGIQKVIATNNPNIDIPKIDIPKVVDEVEILAEGQYPTTIQSFNDKGFDEAEGKRIAFEAGYNKSQETHPNSDDDMAEFAEWLTLNTNPTSIHGEYIYKNVRRVIKEVIIYKNVRRVTKELIQLWKEQRTKTLYYE